MTNPVKKAVILRGISGAGKSSLASDLTDLAAKRGQTYMICSADMFMYEGMEYKFDPKKLGWAHSSCRERFEDACKRNISLVVVDNTNTRHSEYADYIRMAKQYGYEIQVITVGEFTDEALDLYAARGVHNVPHEALVRMRDRFQL